MLKKVKKTILDKPIDPDLHWNWMGSSQTHAETFTQL